ncbi:MAG: lipopolysaccharide biosynthesis protein [Fibrobacterota bacterium]|nr:lipopolysaccharide biosynthesis protein [Fibrobacterota bacterium]QQS07321.1 MAG: lipopolysaccharide biosynthesis protein [Fibrobacterota bacterium]
MTAQLETKRFWGVRMVLMDNLLRPVEPLLVLACASLYAGGQWGTFKLAESLAYLLYRLAMLGMDRGLVWWYGQTTSEGYKKDLVASLWAVLLASAVGSAVLIVFSHLATGAIQGIQLESVDLWLIAGSIPCLAIADILYQANLNRGDMLARIVGKNLVIPLVVFGGALVSRKLGGPGLPFWLFAGTLSNFVLAAVTFQFMHRLTLRDLQPHLPAGGLARFSLVLMGSDLFTGLTARLDLMLLGALSDVRAIEVYNLVVMVGKSLQSIRQSFDGLLLSEFSREGARKLTPWLLDRLNRSAWMIGKLLSLASLVVVLGGKPILRSLHPQYAEGYLPLVVFALTTYLNLRGDLSGIMLQGLGRGKEWLAVQIAGLVVNVGCNVVFIPAWGAFGGILALSASLLAQGALSQMLLRRHSIDRLWSGPYLASSLRFAALALIGCLLAIHLQSDLSRAGLLCASGLGWWLLLRRETPQTDIVTSG